MKKILAALAIAGIIISGCASKGAVKETDQSRQKTTEERHSADKQAEKAKGDVSPKGSEDVDSMRLIKEMQAKMKDIHFDYDRYAVRNDDKPVLTAVAETLRNNGSLKVTIEGNCDERGTNEYNMALGDRRAAAAKDFLLSLGVQSGRMDTISYGEEKPLCTESNEACWAKNRRDHFVLSGGKQ